jgi:hypothetical protein
VLVTELSVVACQNIAAKMSCDREFVVEAKIRGEVEIVAPDIRTAGRSSSMSQHEPIVQSRSGTPASVKTASPAPVLPQGSLPQKPRRNSDVSKPSSENPDMMLLAPSSTRIIARYILPPAVADAVATACKISAKEAVFAAVENAGIQAVDILEMLFEETAAVRGTNRVVDGWVGGAAVKALVRRLDVWLYSFLQSFSVADNGVGSGVCVYSDVVKLAVCKLLVRLYLMTFVRRYVHDKGNRLSRRGCQQVHEDLGIIAAWITTLDEELATQGSNISFVLEKKLMESMQQWLVCKATVSVSQDGHTVLKSYASAIQIFGIKYALEVYDLMRLVLKMRVDVSSGDRKRVLGQCSEFYRQLQGAVQSDPTLMQAGGLGSVGKLSAGVRNRKVIFEDLCPLVGQEHCTGKKWSMEPLNSDIAPIRVLIAQLITAVGEAARAARLASRTITMASNDVPSGSTQDARCNVDESVDGSDSYVYGGRGKRFNSSGVLVLSVRDKRTLNYKADTVSPHLEISNEEGEDDFVEEENDGFEKCELDEGFDTPRTVPDELVGNDDVNVNENGAAVELHAEHDLQEFEDAKSENSELSVSTLPVTATVEGSPSPSSTNSSPRIDSLQILPPKPRKSVASTLQVTEVVVQPSVADNGAAAAVTISDNPFADEATEEQTSGRGSVPVPLNPFFDGEEEELEDELMVIKNTVPAQNVVSSNPFDDDNDDDDNNCGNEKLETIKPQKPPKPPVKPARNPKL